VQKLQAHGRLLSEALSVTLRAAAQRLGFPKEELAKHPQEECVASQGHVHSQGTAGGAGRTSWNGNSKKAQPIEISQYCQLIGLTCQRRLIGCIANNQTTLVKRTAAVSADREPLNPLESLEGCCVCVGSQGWLVSGTV
jgi:hypothetical protein